MPNRIGLGLALLVSLASTSWSAGQALQDARRLAGGNPAVYDGGCSGGSCGAQVTPCQDEPCRINQAAAGALQAGGLVVRPEREPRPALISEVPNPAFDEDEKPGFFRKLGKALMVAGGAAAGARVGFLAGGPIGALIGGLVGALGGFFMSKLLSKK